MSMSSDLLKSMSDTANALGRLQSAQESTLEYVKSVSKRISEVAVSVQEHVADPLAHGRSERRRVIVDVKSWISLVVALCALYVSFRHS